MFFVCLFSVCFRFKQLCEQAFLILRRKGSLLINLFVMMLSAGLPELRSLDDIGYLRKTLVLSLSEGEAIEDFRKKFNYAINNSFSTSMNWFAHNVKRDNPWKGSTIAVAQWSQWRHSCPRSPRYFGQHQESMSSCWPRWSRALRTWNSGVITGAWFGWLANSRVKKTRGKSRWPAFTWFSFWIWLAGEKWSSILIG